MPRFDALLIISFGGPEKHQDVIPFLENVLRGRNVPHERLLEVAEHYYHFDGRSPINDQNRALIAELREVIATPIYWGNRNWNPLLTDTIRQMRDDGIQRAIAFATSAFGSYSSCRQYQENIANACALIQAEDPSKRVPEIVKIRPFSAHPLFMQAMTDRVREALARLPAGRLVFTAHSIPTAMAQASPYVRELEAASKKVAGAVGASAWNLVFQSRSGPPSQPWLTPDIADYLRENKSEFASGVVIVPIGFLSDHMEVIFDLDVEIRAVCDELGIPMARAGTVETHPAMIRMIAELAEQEPEKCPGCCAPMQRPR